MCSSIALVHNVPRTVLLEHCIGVLSVDRCVQQTTPLVCNEGCTEAARVAATVGSRSTPSPMTCRSARALLERSRATACGEHTRGMSSQSRTHYTKKSTAVYLRLVLVQAVERLALLRRRQVIISSVA